MMDPSSSSSSSSTVDPATTGGGGGGVGIPFVSAWIAGVSRRYQHLLDKSTPHVLRRWLGFLFIAFVYVVRVAVIQGFYIVSYGLGIYVLNLLIAFLSPQVDPEIQDLVDGEGPSLPTRSTDEYRPFVRRLPEFKFWVVDEMCWLSKGPARERYGEEARRPSLPSRGSPLIMAREIIVPVPKGNKPSPPPRFQGNQTLPA